MNLDDLQLRNFGDPALKVTPPPFDFETGDAHLLCKLLHEKTALLAGAGISATQVGIDSAVFTMIYGEEFKRTLFNPVLVSVGPEQVTMREGCLTFPGLWLNLTRPSEATFKYQDVEGLEVVETYVGIAARIALHEYDHMIGQNFTMRASKLKIKRAVRYIDNRVKKYNRKIGRTA